MLLMFNFCFGVGVGVGAFVVSSSARAGKGVLLRIFVCFFILSGCVWCVGGVMVLEFCLIIVVVKCYL